MARLFLMADVDGSLVVTQHICPQWLIERCGPHTRRLPIGGAVRTWRIPHVRFHKGDRCVIMCPEEVAEHRGWYIAAYESGEIKELGQVVDRRRIPQGIES